MSGLRIAALVFGIAFVVVGILGFFPAFAPNQMLLGMFMVDGLHNWVHIISGIVALLAVASDRYSRLYFQVFGIIYLLVTIGGFLLGGNLFVIHVNMADNFLHLVIAVVALYFGFFFKKRV